MPDILPSDMTPLVKALLAIIEQLSEQVELQKQEINQLKDEIRVLKKQKKKPAFKPSKMDEETDKTHESTDKVEKKKHQKRSKTCDLTIHSTEIRQPILIPDGAIFKGYSDYVVQDIKLALNNTCYRLARYRLPDGTLITGQLPEELKDHHFGAELRTYILYQYS